MFHDEVKTHQRRFVGGHRHARLDDLASRGRHLPDGRGDDDVFAVVDAVAGGVGFDEHARAGGSGDDGLLMSS